MFSMVPLRHKITIAIGGNCGNNNPIKLETFYFGFSIFQILRSEEYQGVRAPVMRSEIDFDPGAKYHIAANVEYLR